MPLLRRFKKSTFHGSSTPTGLRGMYWQMCCKLAEYKEFFHPVQDHPEWGTEQLNEEVCFAEAKTMDRYRHEWLAEFGDPTAGVFKAAFVDAALKPFPMTSCVFDPNAVTSWVWIGMARVPARASLSCSTIRRHASAGSWRTLWSTIPNRPL